MPEFTRGDVTIAYDLEGPDDGFPVLLIAPGGMRSANALWDDKPFDPRTELSDSYRLIGMDQRNAGRSTAPIRSDDGWAVMRADQLALLDHLGVERCHVVGMCIGGPYIAGLLAAAPERFAAAVVLQPVGIEADGGNRSAFYEMFDQWAASIDGEHPEADESTWHSFRSNMWDGEFVLTASPDQVAAIETPMLVAMGNDLYHPRAMSRQFADLAPNVAFVEEWKEGDARAAFATTAGTFLARHTP